MTMFFSEPVNLTFLLLIPRKETVTFAGKGTPVKENSPFRSVMTPLSVPSTSTEAPGSGAPSESTTFPVTEGFAWS